MIRSEVWKFLLGYYPWESTLVERKELRDQKVEEYFRMKLQWRSLSAKQESRFAAFKQRKDLIGNTAIKCVINISFTKLVCLPLFF